MKLKSGFELVEVAGEFIIIPVGENVSTFQGMLCINEETAYIIKKMEFHHTQTELVMDLVEEYEVDQNVASNDVDDLIKRLLHMGLLEA